MSSPNKWIQYVSVQTKKKKMYSSSTRPSWTKKKRKNYLNFFCIFGNKDKLTFLFRKKCYNLFKRSNCSYFDGVCFRGIKMKGKVQCLPRFFRGRVTGNITPCHLRTKNVKLERKSVCASVCLSAFMFVFVSVYQTHPGENLQGQFWQNIAQMVR